MYPFKLDKSMFIDNVLGICPECNEKAFLVAVVKDYYRCTNCGEDTKQYINGHIRYIKLNENERNFISKRGKKSSNR
jgi:DNA-directed RNA polymerase subunit RPC12/RpoP